MFWTRGGFELVNIQWKLRGRERPSFCLFLFLSVFSRVHRILCSSRFQNDIDAWCRDPVPLN